MVKLQRIHLYILIKLRAQTLERKIMHKSKGRWVVLSSSLLVSAFALSLVTPVAQAEEITDDSAVISDEVSTNDAPEEAIASLTDEESELVDNVVDELISDVISADETLVTDETEVEAEAKAVAMATEAPAVFANTRVAAGAHAVAYGDTL